jgi:hypothetical protein
MDPEVIAAEINIPLEDWPGNCHGIAEAILRRLPIAGMRLVRGHYDGWVSKDSVYRGSIQQHSWLELEDGRILDPTRWAMSNPKKPSIYLGENDHYDEASIGMKAKSRPAIAMSMFMQGHAATGPQAAVLQKLQDLPTWRVEELFEAGGLTAPSGEIGNRDAERLYDRLSDPVEHFREPEAFFGKLRDAGLSAMVPIDIMTRVLDPEKVFVDRGANLLYEAPAAEEINGTQKLFKIFCRFLSIEARELHIENELEEIGYTLDDLHTALNDMESWLKYDPEASYLPRDITDTLSVIASDLLGKGFGVEIEIERYAKSIGLDRDGLHRELVSFGERAQYDLAWLCGEEACLAMEGGALEDAPDDMEM